MSYESKDVRGKPNARNLLAKIAAKEKDQRQREFLAPYCEGLKHAFVKIEKVAYRFKIVGFQGSGFGIFKPIDPTCARFIRDADPILVSEYLEKLPRIYLILVCETDLGWCAYPFNASSAKSNIGVEQEIIVRGVSDVERFDVVAARYDGIGFWFEEPFVGADPIKAEALRESFAKRESLSETSEAVQGIKGLTPEEKRAFQLAVSSWKAFQKVTTEGRIRSMLAAGGAELDSYVIRGDSIELAWRSRAGGFYSTVINKETFDVEAAGICVESKGDTFHLQDLPGVIREGEDSDLIYRTRDTRFMDLDGDPPLDDLSQTFMGTE